MLSVSAAANALPLDTSVKPAVTSLSNPAPKTGLYVGNSFTYYNCGLVGYVRGFAKAAGIPWRARQITISSGRLSYHPMAQYLAPHELDPYAKGKVKDGKLTAPCLTWSSFRRSARSRSTRKHSNLEKVSEV